MRITRLLLIVVFLAVPGLGTISVVEVPIPIGNVYLKRIPGITGFFWCGRVPSTGKLFAIPELEMSRFIQLANENGITGGVESEYPFLPPGTAIRELAKVNVEIEHTGELRFWKNDDAVWITWDDDHPAPSAFVNGEVLETFWLASAPDDPGPLIAD